jgi:hypothetical protein
VPEPMFARVSQFASECCPERGRMPSRPAIEPKRGLFGTSMQIHFMNLGNTMVLEEKN